MCILGYVDYGMIIFVQPPKKVLDGTTKEEPPMGVRRTQFETLYPETLQKWVVENWERLGFTEEARWNDDYLKASF